MAKRTIMLQGTQLFNQLRTGRWMQWDLDSLASIVFYLGTPSHSFNSLYTRVFFIFVSWAFLHHSMQVLGFALRTATLTSRNAFVLFSDVLRTPSITRCWVHSSHLIICFLLSITLFSRACSWSTHALQQSCITFIIFIIFIFESLSTPYWTSTFCSETASLFPLITGIFRRLVLVVGCCKLHLRACIVAHRSVRSKSRESLSPTMSPTNELPKPCPVDNNPLFPQALPFLEGRTPDQMSQWMTGMPIQKISWQEEEGVPAAAWKADPFPLACRTVKMKSQRLWVVRCRTSIGIRMLQIKQCATHTAIESSS